MNYIKTLSLVACAAITLSSCDSFLDKVPDERVELNTENQVLSFLTSGYPSGNWGWVAELSSDNMMDNNAPHYPHNPDDKQVLIHYNLSSYNRADDQIFAFEADKVGNGQDSPSSIWSGYYGAIATANQALVDIEKIAGGKELTPKLKAARAEALLIRAYSHFILVNVFSKAYKNDEASSKDIGIPYITLPEETVKPHYDRRTVTATYNDIEKDLIEGLADVTDAYYDKPKWHFNTNAAHAFAARFYLYKRDYAKVIEHADAVLGKGTANLSTMLMDYKDFDNCTYAKDFANVWQSPAKNNNLMLMDTYSVQFRRSIGYRYSCVSTALKDVVYHTTQNSRWYVYPTYYVAGMFGKSEYGYAPAKLAEQFQYTDKVAGIGYVHLIRREFTATMLLLDRIEAKLLSSTPDVAGAVEDLLAFDVSRQNFSEANTKTFTANDALTPLTEEMILRHYTRPKSNNVFENWDFTQRMSADFVVNPDLVVYMNCLNDFRRFESWGEGWRFFDLKRYGIEYSHVMGLDAVEERLTWNDDRRAIEVPQQVIAAGLQPSRPLKNEELLPESEYKYFGKTNN